jgi:hypothetical protein
MTVPPSFVNNRTLGFAERTSMEIKKPENSIAGDVVIVNPYVEVNGKAITVTCGAATVFEVNGSQKQSGAVFRQGSFWFIDDGTENLIKVAWAGSENKGSVCSTDAWRGCDQTTPIDVAGAWQETTGKTGVSASITTVTPNTTQVMHGVNANGTELNATPAGWTLRKNFSPFTISRTKEAAGETGTTEYELTISRTEVHWSYALRPKPDETKSGVLISAAARAVRGLVMR